MIEYISTRISSIAIVLGGSVMYTYLKDREMRQAAAQQHQPIPMSNTTVVDMDDEVNEADALIREQEREEELRREEAERELMARKA